MSKEWQGKTKMKNRHKSLGYNYLLRTGVSAIVFIILITLIVLKIVIIIQDNNRLQKEVGSISENLTSLYIAVINQETGQRGYILTKDEEYLIPFYQGKQAFHAKEILLLESLEEYPQFSEHILDTIKWGRDWTETYGIPLVHMIVEGKTPSEKDLLGEKEAFDHLRNSFVTTSHFIKSSRAEIADKSGSRLIYLLIISVLLVLTSFTLIWVRMYKEFRSIVVPIAELNHCLQEYTKHNFTKNPPIYNVDNELGELIFHSELMRRELEENQIQMEKKVYTDGLTELYNRRFFDLTIENEWELHRDAAYKLSIILFDIDYFKRFNDTYGHVVGDDCLKMIAGVMKELFHASADFPVRYGGEEFAVILTLQDHTAALKKAEQLRLAIEALKIPHKMSKVSRWVTISAGVATIVPDKNQDIQAFIKTADEALYQSKLKGRNQVTSSIM